MRILFFFLFFPFVGSFAQLDIKIYNEKTKDGYKIYADNLEHAPVTVEMDFQLNNLRLTYGQKAIYVLKPNKRRQFISELKIQSPGKAFGYGYKMKSNYGDHFVENYDEDYNYFLPFSRDSSYRVDQGYNGTFSHKDEFSLDFGMPEGTEITAVREGVVVKVVQHNSGSCPTIECKVLNNYIMIYHPDGTFSKYFHIMTNGSKVAPGDKVEKGQVIALSGNVGFSTGPHLHLVVYLQQMEDWKSLPTKFLVNEGESVFLNEKESYIRKY